MGVGAEVVDGTSVAVAGVVQGKEGSQLGGVVPEDGAERSKVLGSSVCRGGEGRGLSAAAAVQEWPTLLVVCWHSSVGRIVLQSGQHGLVVLAHACMQWVSCTFRYSWTEPRRRWASYGVTSSNSSSILESGRGSQQAYRRQWHTTTVATSHPLALPTLQPHPLPTFLQSSTREQVASSSRGWSGVELARLCCQWADSRLHRVRVTP